MTRRAVRNLSKLILICIVQSILLFQICASEDAYACNKHFIWKVSSGSNTLYIMGSLHLLTKDSYPLNEAYMNAFDRSDVIVFEVDPGTLEKPETMRMMLSKATLKGDKTLNRVLSGKTYKLTGDKLKELGADIQMYNKSEPWFVAISLGVLKLKSLGLEGDEGVDKYFYDRALQSGKKVKGLETAEFQVDLLAKAGGANQEELLLQTLKDLDVMEHEFNEIVDSWDSGDTERLEAAMLESYNDYPLIYEELIGQRNKTWLSEIERYLGLNENYLVVVGSGHLVGKEGLINLLRQRGYKVEQM